MVSAGTGASAGVSAGASAARAIPLIHTAVITRATTYCNFINPRFSELEIQPCQQVQGVVVGSGAAAAVIAARVVAVLPVELLVADVLCLQLGIEPRQVIELENVAVRVGAVIRAAGDRRGSVEQRIAAAGCAEVSDRAADFPMVIILAHQLEGLQVVVGVCGKPVEDAGIEGLALVDIGAERGEQMVLANELILDIGGDIRPFIDRTGERIAVAGVSARAQAVGADFKGVSVPPQLVGHAPIGSYSLRHGRVGAVEWVSAAPNRRGVQGQLG